MMRILLAFAVLCGCSRDDGAPSAADRRELDAAAAMLDQAGGNVPATETPAADGNAARR